MPDKRTSVLSIAGFDPTSGAGILADAAVFRSLGIHPLCVLTSVAAQGASGVRQIRTLPRHLITRELEVIAGEFSPSAVKVGMVFSPPAVRSIAAFLERTKIPAVCDPILKSSRGDDLIQRYAVPLLESLLFPLCRLVTPNLLEAGHFLDKKVADLLDAERAAQELSRRWGTAVLLKGGHLTGQVIDVLALDGKLEKYPHPRASEGMSLRGTGCALSSAVAVGFARGLNVRKAVEFALEYVQEAIAHHYTSGSKAKVGFLDYPSKQLLGQSRRSR